jgi:transcriptional regulator with XRE-family HTH domain
MITKRKLVKIFGTGIEVARVLGISGAAVAKWPKDKPIPELRLLQLQTLFPEQFGQPRAVERGGFETRYKNPGRPESRP